MNSDQVNEAIAALGLQPGSQNIPGTSVVVESNPKVLKRPDVIGKVTSTGITLASSTIISAAAGKSFVICGYQYSGIKDATLDGASGSEFRLSFTVGGAVRTIVLGTFLTLTAQTWDGQVSLQRPIKCDTNSAVITLWSATSTVGTASKSVSVWGYFEEANRGLPA